MAYSYEVYCIPIKDIGTGVVLCGGEKEKACVIFHCKVSCGLKTFPIKDIGIDFLLDGKIANIV